MNKLHITAIAAAISLAFSVGAMAQSMSKDDYKASKDRIVAEYKSAKAGCDSFAGNANDICIVEAKGKENIALADLDASYKPTTSSHYKAHVAKAEAAYATAKEKCDDHAGNLKDVCLEEAEAAAIAAKADAKAQMKVSAAKEVADDKSAHAQAKGHEKAAEAHMKANEESSEAHMKANEEATDARKDAAADKRDAEYSVAKVKCDALASDAKELCMHEAKARYGKS